MSEDFMKWAGLDDARWTVLQDKLIRLVETERTPVRIIMALMEDNSIGYREHIVLAYLLGRQQVMLATCASLQELERVLISGLS